jgi:hypothetical protein
MHKQTTVDQIEIRPDGTVGIRFAKQVVDDDGTVLSSGWDRSTPMAPGCDIDAQMAAVNAGLADLGYPAVTDADIARIKAQAAAAWTPDVISAYAVAVAARQTAARQGDAA